MYAMIVFNQCLQKQFPYISRKLAFFSVTAA